ncbi:MAG: hypothetical protein LBI81_02300 [Puniceicoccales bacterium]|jgi:hypothetical protein|nr:hypothetical protein [Puniceicoccales bacterium]
MDNLKILSAKFIWANSQEPGVEFGLEILTPQPEHVIAIVSEVRPMLFDRNLVYLCGKSARDVKLLRENLTAKTIPAYNITLESVTDDPKIVKSVQYFLDAANRRDGLFFTKGDSIPKDLLT